MNRCIDCIPILIYGVYILYNAIGYKRKKEETLHRMSYPDAETTEMLGESIARSLATPMICCCSSTSLREYAHRVHKKTKSLCQRLYTLFTTHPHEHHMTYTGHALRALRRAVLMGKGAIGLCIHSVFPFLCEKSGTKVVDQLHEEIHQTKKKELK